MLASLVSHADESPGRCAIGGDYVGAVDPDMPLFQAGNAAARNLYRERLLRHRPDLKPYLPNKLEMGASPECRKEHKRIYSGRMKDRDAISKRDQALRLIVLSAIADDYESFRIIAHESSEWAGELGLAVNHTQILGVLADLIRQGFARAYVLSPQVPYAEQAEYSPDRYQFLWYWITDEGKLLLKEMRREEPSRSPLAIDPKSPSASSIEPAFIARPEGEPVYHGFKVLSNVVVEGFTLGKITDFEVESTDTGDAFVVAPDNSRAGLVWEVSSNSYFEEVLGMTPDRWGVWAVSFPHPMVQPRQRSSQS